MTAAFAFSIYVLLDIFLSENSPGPNKRTHKSRYNLQNADSKFLV